MFGTAKNNQDVNKVIDNMVDEGDPLTDAVRESARHLRDAARNVESSIKDDLAAAAKHTKEQVRDFAGTAQHQAADISDAVTAKIKKNPLQSSLLALGVGFVAGMIYRR